MDKKVNDMAEKIEILTKKKKNRHLRNEKLIESKGKKQKTKTNNGLSEKKKDALNREQR